MFEVLIDKQTESKTIENVIKIIFGETTAELFFYNSAETIEIRIRDILAINGSLV